MYKFSLTKVYASLKAFVKVEKEPRKTVPLPVSSHTALPDPVAEVANVFSPAHQGLQCWQCQCGFTENTRGFNACLRCNAPNPHPEASARQLSTFAALTCKKCAPAVGKRFQVFNPATCVSVTDANAQHHLLSRCLINLHGSMPLAECSYI